MGIYICFHVRISKELNVCVCGGGWSNNMLVVDSSDWHNDLLELATISIGRQFDDGVQRDTDEWHFIWQIELIVICASRWVTNQGKD